MPKCKTNRPFGRGALPVNLPIAPLLVRDYSLSLPEEKLGQALKKVVSLTLPENQAFFKTKRSLPDYLLAIHEIVTLSYGTYIFYSYFKDYFSYTLINPQYSSIMRVN